jgi:alpha-L-fucosidase 2
MLIIKMMLKLKSRIYLKKFLLILCVSLFVSSQVPTKPLVANAASSELTPLTTTLPTDVKAQLDAYNVSWNTPSTNSAGSMPIGNGDISANVWVEKGGDLYFYIGKTDTWSEATRLLKLGKVHVKITPNPFADGNSFLQVLKIYNGEMLINAGPPGQQVNLRVWVDANNPVIHVEATGDQAFQMQVSNEIWRNTAISMNSSTAMSYRGVKDHPPSNPTESADQTLSRTDRIVWYHKNNTSLYQLFLDTQHLNGYQNTYPDPYMNRTFGAAIKGDNLSKIDDTTLRSNANGTSFSFSVYPYTAVTSSVDDWENQLNTNITNIESVNIETARTNHYNWWDAFWNRSWVFITGDADATTVTRGYIMQRFMEAIQGRGKYPIKFNGGTINFDYGGKNADFRQWGPNYWFQNTRLLYWNMLASGDFDMMIPLFRMYQNMLPLQKDITRQYFNHDGAFFPETINFFGLYSIDDFGWSNPNVLAENSYMKYYWQGGIELSAMMLEYYDYTKDDTFLSDTLIPFADQAVTFFDKHYARVNGVLNINPSQVTEQYQSGVTNPTDVVSGLRQVLPKLLALPITRTTQAQRDAWQSLLGAVPAIPTGTSGTATFIKPAQAYNTTSSNVENPELYAVFPYKQYGIGKPDLNVGIETFKRRINRFMNCWSQDGIEAAFLGLASDARTAVISHFSSIPSAVRFPGFWSENNDWMPDLDNGGSAMSALQAMLIQSSGSDIRILPAWPTSWNVDFKLHTENKTTVRVKYGVGATEIKLESDLGEPAKLHFNKLNGVRVLTSGGQEVSYTATGQDLIEFPTQAGETYTLAVPETPLELLGIKAPAAITIEGGAAKTAEALGLPKTVKLGTVRADVDASMAWNVETSSYDPSQKYTKQTFNVTGTVTLPTGLLNPNNLPLTTSVSVTVNPFGKVEAENYTAMSGIQTEDSSEGTKDVGYIDSGDWMDYVVNVPETGFYKLNYRVASPVNTGKVDFLVDGVSQKITSLPSTGGYQTWKTVSDEVSLIAGNHTIRLRVEAGGWNINWFELSPVGGALQSIQAPSAITGVANGKPKTAAALGLPASVTLVTNTGSMNADVAWNVEESSYDPSQTSEQSFTVGGTVTLPAGVLNPNNVGLTTSISVTVLASPPPQSGLTIEAENYAAMSNVVVESGGSGGSHLGYLDANDWMEYNVNIPTTGTYAVKYTVGVNKTGIVNFLVDGVSQKVTTLPSTGGWNNWATVSDTVTLSKGTHTIRLQVVESGWNLDKFELNPLKKNLTSIQSPAAVTGVANGTAKTTAALGLPGTVTLVTDDGNADASVAWNVDASSYDPTQHVEQTFAVSGTVTLPAEVDNSNNVGLTTSISVTVLPAPTTAQSTLTGPQQAAAGQSFDVKMGLSSVTQSVYQQMYAQDLTLHYDPMKLEFNSVTSLIEGFQVIDQKEAMPGHVRIVAASVGSNQGVLAQGDLLNFKFTVKSVTQATNTAISVGNVVIGNGQGKELQIGGANREMQISVPSTPVDKLPLNASITSAQAKYNAAAEGNEDGQYVIGSKAHLQSAIDAAKAVANDPNATQLQVDNAKAALEAEVQAFEAKRISADVNGKDGTTIGDLAVVAAVYGKQQGQAGWNEKADVNHDGKVDILDLAIVAKAILK